MAVRRKCLRAAQAELSAGLLNGLVEAMRASSPTHARAAAALAAGVDEEHAAWMVRIHCICHSLAFIHRILHSLLAFRS
jgi:trehalose 6-phosphate phosphatase